MALVIFFFSFWQRATVTGWPVIISILTLLIGCSNISQCHEQIVTFLHAFWLAEKGTLTASLHILTFFMGTLTRPPWLPDYMYWLSYHWLTEKGMLPANLLIVTYIHIFSLYVWKRRLWMPIYKLWPLYICIYFPSQDRAHWLAGYTLFLRMNIFISNLESMSLYTLSTSLTLT